MRNSDFPLILIGYTFLILLNRVGYSPGAREPGSHEIFRLTRNFCSNSCCFAAYLKYFHICCQITHNINKILIATGRNFLSQKEISYQGQKFLVTRKNFLSQEKVSCHRKKFLVKRRNFL